MKRKLSVLLAVLLCPALFSSCSPAPPSADPPEVEQPPAQTAAKKVYEQSEWVFDTPEDFPKSDHNSVTLPFVNIDSEDAKDVNAQIIALASEIDSDYREQIKDIENAEEEYPWYTSIGYSHFVNGDILSLKLDIESGGTDVPFIRCETYNFSLKTGQRLSPDSLFQALGLTAAQAEGLISEAIAAEVAKNREAYSYSEDPDAEMAGDLEKTTLELEKARDTEELQLFLDKDGALMLCLIVYRSPVHWGYYPAILKIK